LAVSHYESGSHHHTDDSPPDAAAMSGDSQPSGDSKPSSPVRPPATTNFETVSLDDAWKTLTAGAKQANGKVSTDT